VKIVSAVDSVRLFTAKIRLPAITIREDVISYRFSSTLYSTDSLTSYNGQRRGNQLLVRCGSLQHRFTYNLITARKDGVSYRFSSIHYSTDLLTNYNSQGIWYQRSIRLNSLQHRFTYILSQPEKMVSASDSARLSTAQIHLLPVTAREDGVSYRFNSTLYRTGSLTSYNSQRRWSQRYISSGFYATDSPTDYKSQKQCGQQSIQRNIIQCRFTYLL
jgi:hypothetical protein